MRTLTFSAAKLFLFLITLGCAIGVAQEPKNGTDEPGSLNEQTIYIPYEKLREVFERDGRGVFLPYDKFQQLWNEARQNQPKKTRSQRTLGRIDNRHSKHRNAGNGDRQC